MARPSDYEDKVVYLVVSSILACLLLLNQFFSRRSELSESEKITMIEED